MAKNIITLNLDNVDYTTRPYAVCDTAGNIKDKVANCTDFNLTTGATILVKFTKDNTSTDTLTLNINGTGAKNIVCSNRHKYLSKDVYYEFLYNGTNYIMMTDNDFLSLDGGQLDGNLYLPNNYIQVGSEGITSAYTKIDADKFTIQNNTNGRFIEESIGGRSAKISLGTCDNTTRGELIKLEVDESNNTIVDVGKINIKSNTGNYNSCNITLTPINDRGYYAGGVDIQSGSSSYIFIGTGSKDSLSRQSIFLNGMAGIAKIGDVHIDSSKGVYPDTTGLTLGTKGDPWFNIYSDDINSKHLTIADGNSAAIRLSSKDSWSSLSIGSEGSKEGSYNFKFNIGTGSAYDDYKCGGVFSINNGTDRYLNLMVDTNVEGYTKLIKLVIGSNDYPKEQLNLEIGTEKSNIKLGSIVISHDRIVGGGAYLGASDEPWAALYCDNVSAKNITATKFTGDLDGNATSSDKAYALDSIYEDVGNTNKKYSIAAAAGYSGSRISLKGCTRSQQDELLTLSVGTIYRFGDEGDTYPDHAELSMGTKYIYNLYSDGSKYETRISCPIGNNEFYDLYKLRAYSDHMLDIRLGTSAGAVSLCIGSQDTTINIGTSLYINTSEKYVLGTSFHLGTGTNPWGSVHASYIYGDLIGIADLAKSAKSLMIGNVGNLETPVYFKGGVPVACDLDNNNTYEVTYNNLMNLKNEGNLVPGKKYRITDYTAAASSRKSWMTVAGNKFDIILEAISTTTLSENAKAIHAKYPSGTSSSILDFTMQLSSWTNPTDTGNSWWAEIKNDIQKLAPNIYAGVTNDSLGEAKFSSKSFPKGKATVTFQYQSGNKDVHCLGVVVLNGGQIIAKDIHIGITGYAHNNNVYSLDIPTAGSYQIRMYVDKWRRSTGENRNDMDAVCKLTVNHIDDYFANCDLNAWDIKYCADHIPEKFQWSPNDTAEYKGIIYYIKDEFGNEANYDFKNIKMDGYYTFNYNGNDGSVTTNRVWNNKIALQPSLSNLNMDLFKCYFKNTSDDFICANNTIGPNCQNIIFGNSCDSNTIRNYCENITMGNYSSYNDIDTFCKNITTGDYFQSNTIGKNCETIECGDYFVRNKIGNKVSSLNFYKSASGTTKLVGVHGFVIDDKSSSLTIRCTSSSDFNANTGNYVQYFNIPQNSTGTITIDSRSQSESTICVKESSSFQQYKLADAFGVKVVDATNAEIDALF